MIGISISNSIGYNRGGQGYSDNTLTYQDQYLETVGNEYETDFTPANISGLEVWADLTTVTSSDIPGADDALASIPNSGTGTDLAQSTSGERPLYKTNVGPYVEPVWSGTREITDSWWRNQLKCMRISSGKRMTLTPEVQNPTYLEGFIIVNLTSTTSTIFSHRSESTRLIQVGVAATTNKYVLQLRSSGNSLKTLTSTVSAFRGTIDIIYFRFDKAGNNHAISVNGETEVTDTTNFGSETFTSTRQTWGGYYDGSAYQNGPAGNYYELIVKYSAFSSQDKTDTLQYLRYKYLEYGLSPVLTHTRRANSRTINVGDDVVSILAALQDDTYVTFAVGEHIVEADMIITASQISIEIPEGVTIKRANNSTELAPAEIVYNQLTAANITMQGTYTGLNSADFWIKVDGTGSPNTFSWQKQDGTTGSQPSPYANTGVAVTGDWQDLSDGIQIKFAATTGNSLNSGAIVTIGAVFHGFRIGDGTQEDYIEDVKIFGAGTLNMNQSNNLNHAVHSVDLPYAVLFHGRVRNCGVYGITVQDIHRAPSAYGEHTGTYGAGGTVTGGTSYDAEFIDIKGITVDNTQQTGYGILLGHPQHRGLLKYVRCDDNTLDTFATPIEPNFKLINYSCCDNLATRGDTVYTDAAYHCWRRSDDGILANNVKTASDHLVTRQNAPAGWDAPVNIMEYNNTESA